MFKKFSHSPSFTWRIQVFIYRPRSSGQLASSKKFLEASSSSNMKFNNKKTFSHKLNQFRMVVQNQEFGNNNYNLLEHFAWLCEIFAWSCKISLAIFLCLQHNSTFWSIHMIMRNGNIWFLNFLLLFLPFLPFESTSTTFKSAPNLDPNTLLLPHHPYYLPSLIPFLFCHSMLQKSP